MRFPVSEMVLERKWADCCRAPWSIQGKSIPRTSLALESGLTSFD